MKKSYTTNFINWIISFCLFVALTPCMGFSQTPAWSHFYIDQVLPGSTYGTSGPILADFDHDGDLDAMVSRRNTREAYWYERKNDSLWIPHLVGQLGNSADGLGATGLDMDKDGWVDAVFDGIWFKNPGVLDKYPDTPWKQYNYKGGGHDIVNCDLDGDGKDEVIVYDGRKLSVFDPSDKMMETVISTGNDDHGGTAPHGFGDIDGDGDIDLVIPGFWYANPGVGTGKWNRHEWPFIPIPNASYGRSTRAWIADINTDGKKDIVYSHCDTGGSHVYWVENKDKGTTWVSHQLTDPPTREGDVPGTGSFHSLGVADFNHDGFPDIFAGEQEDPDTYMEKSGKVAMKPRGLKERGVIWYNNGNKTPGFSVFVIHVDNPGWHDAQLGDVDADGDTDIVSKIWNADGLFYHLDYWRNELKKNINGSVGTVRPKQTGEFMIVDEVYTYDNALNGFKWWNIGDIKGAPANWKTPYDYEFGQIYERYEIISQATSRPAKLQFGFWQDNGSRESLSSHTKVIGAGYVTTRNSSPATWWEKDTTKPLDFSRPGDFLHLGIPLWSDNTKLVSSWVSNNDWALRDEYQPMKVRATIVAVAKGTEFSGWDHWIGK